MKISVEKLKRLNACTEQVELFEQIFGNEEITVTEKLCVEHADKFAWGWAARNLFSAPLCKEYKSKHAVLQVEYAAKCAPLWAKYDTKTATLWAEYEAKRSERSALRVEYKAKCASLFGALAER